MCTVSVRHEKDWVIQGAPPKAASSMLRLVQRIDAETPGVSTLPTSNSIDVCYAE